LNRYTEEELLNIEMEEEEPILEGLFNYGENIMLVAPQKSGKSVFTQQLALATAHGVALVERWRPRRPLRVLYLDFENKATNLKRRLRRMLNGMEIGTPGANLVYIKLPYLFLNTDEGAKALEQLVTDEAPDLLILDPLYRMVKGGVNKDEEVGDATAILNAISQAHGHATWLVHHEHRAKHDSYGMEYETDSQKYAGSWVLAAWPDMLLGFKFNKMNKSATLALYDQRESQLEAGEKVGLLLEDTPASLIFKPGLADRLMGALPALYGKSISAAAREYSVAPETMRRVLQEFQKNGIIILVPNGRETLIGSVS
jgi:RecA-family ATPase